MYGRTRKNIKNRKSNYKSRQMPRKKYTTRKVALPMQRRIHWNDPVKKNSEFMRLTYQDTAFPAAMTTATSYLYNQTFRHNSLYDPDFTGVGVQPYGLDQLFGVDKFYGNYIVYGSRITITPYYPGNDVGNAIRGAVCTVFPFNSANCTYDEVNDLARIPYKKQVCIRSLDDLTRTRRIVNYISYRKLSGKDPRDNVAQYNANPVNGTYWVVKWNNQAAGVDLTMKYDVRIDYYIKAIKIDNINES